MHAPGVVKELSCRGGVFLGYLEIKRLIEEGRLVVEPLREDTVRENGLDLRLGCEYAIPKTLNAVIDPVEMDDTDIQSMFEIRKGDVIIIPPRSFILAVTEEYIKLPEDVIGLCNLRSTLARLGLSIPPTIADAGFEGQLVLEIFNNNPNFIRLRPGIRFLHLVLAYVKDAKPYNGYYKGQRGVRLPKSLSSEF